MLAKNLSFGFLLIISQPIFAQNDNILDSVVIPIEVEAERIQKPLFSDSALTFSLSIGKKNEVISLNNAPNHISEKVGRQVFAKLAGVLVYDMDGSGNQINIATRGLDPHRSWEYNMRFNNIMTNSDIYGYPASHFSPPLEAIDRIEIIRGAASIAYGAQFGGTVNFISKPASPKKLAFELIQTVGSYGLLSSYLSASGTIGKWTYSGYFQRRQSDGYRQNAQSKSGNEMISASYQPHEKVKIIAEIARSSYLHQNPGPLTDSMFYQNPRQSTRQRNYFNPNIYLSSLSLAYQISPKQQLTWRNNALIGTRSSVQFIAWANVADAINNNTLQRAPRQVDIDRFNSWQSDLRYNYNYSLWGQELRIDAGLVYTHNRLHRRQLGQGSRGEDFDITVVNDSFGRNIVLQSQNIALFVEKTIFLAQKWQASAGIRAEKGYSGLSGTLSYLDNPQTQKNINRLFAISSFMLQYKPNSNQSIYANFAQAYRPVTLAEMTAANSLERVAADINDSRGFNAELGYRGKIKKKFSYDITLYVLQYNDKIGNQQLTDPNGQSYVLRTNIGDSRTLGVESLVEYVLINRNGSSFAIFSANSIAEGRYLSGSIREGNTNIDLKGKRVETCPRFISRTGATLSYKTYSLSAQYSFVSESFSDPINTEIPSSNGGKGIVPSYQIWDAHFSCIPLSRLRLQFSANNLLNKNYFTKRPSTYPGQGIWSSDGRSFVLSVFINL